MSASHRNTPVVAELTASDAYRVDDLDSVARETVIEDLGEWIPEIPFDIFESHLLPKIAGFDVSCTVKALERSRALKYDPERKVWSWSAFTTEPKHIKGREAVAFKALETVNGQICEHAQFPGGGSQPTAVTTFVVCGDSQLTSEADTNRTPNPSKPDGCRFLNSNQSEFMPSCKLQGRVSPQGKDDWYNVADVEEYKKGETLQDQNDVCTPV